jgi:hypothetical protein
MPSRFASSGVRFALRGRPSSCSPPSPRPPRPRPAGFRPYAPDSVWNLPLRDDAQLHARSSAWVSSLVSSVQAHGGWINSTQCGTPMYWADQETPRVSVRLEATAYQDPALLRAWSSVPIPANALPANCSDKNFSVQQRQPDGRVTSWEFFGARKDATGQWYAKWGGVTSDVQADGGVASSLAWVDPTAPTALRAARSSTGTSRQLRLAERRRHHQEDLVRGEIDHAVSMALFDTAKSTWLWPAQRSDGGSIAPARYRPAPGCASTRRSICSHSR